MKHNSNSRRSRSRGGNKRQGGGRNNFESNGPEVKVRGTAQQVLDKYLALGRDAASAGDRINAESYFQHAEHYYRVLNADQGENQNRRDRRPSSPADADTPESAGDAAKPAEAQSEAPQAEPALAEAPVDPAEQPQPDIADMIPPAIETARPEKQENPDDEEAAPKPRRRRSRAKPAADSDKAETVQA
ncbi:MAG: DUF4167 domain-containing protein [Magnetovibrio sp.]|nr:DUF4167 domain-containing protein [Magnetovibrio sp.]